MVKINLAGTDAGSQDVGDDLGRQPGKIEQRVDPGEFQKSRSAIQIARADQDVFKVQVAMNDGLRTGDGLIQPLFQLLKRVWQAKPVKILTIFRQECFSGWQ